jgi:hypothetical protein
LTFVAQDFPRSKFHEGFYRRPNTFGHIANYDSAGFYGRFFLTAADKLEFLEQCVTWSCHGDPTYTYSDVERAVAARVRSANIVTLMRSQVSAAGRQADLALLAELKARYEPIPHAPTPGVPDGSLPLFDTRKGARDALSPLAQADSLRRHLAQARRIPPQAAPRARGLTAPCGPHCSRSARRRGGDGAARRSLGS